MSIITSEQTASDLLAIGAVFLRPSEPFTWASGIKSPIYCDNRLTLSVSNVRDRIAHSFAKVIQDNYPECEALFGTATAGIPHAAITAHLMGLPMGYVRGGAKDHGRQNQIEGRLDPGAKVVVIEDLVSTGGSLLDAIDALLNAGANVLGAACIFTYGMAKSINAFAERGINLVSLTDFDTLVQLASREGGIQSSDIPRLIRFRDNPSDPSWMAVMPEVM